MALVNETLAEVAPPATNPPQSERARRVARNRLVSFGDEAALMLANLSRVELTMIKMFLIVTVSFALTSQ